MLGLRLLSEVGRSLGDGGDRPDTDVLCVEELQPLGEWARREDRHELCRECFLVGVELALCQLCSAEHLCQAAEEDGLEGGER
jgi:hypothetical protein